MSLISNLHISYYYSLSYWDSFGQTILRVFFISSLAAFLGTYTGTRYYHLKKIWLFPLVIFMSITGALTGVLMSNVIVDSFFSEIQIQLGRETGAFTFFSAIISAVVISVIATVISDLLERNASYKRQILEAKSQKEPEYFLFKSRDKRFKILLNEIIYLTSYGKKSILHTCRGDIELSMILKDAAGQLPGKKFLRVHKKHFINVYYIESLNHIERGNYEIYLNDSDASIVPVGRTYLYLVQSLFLNRKDQNDLVKDRV